MHTQQLSHGEQAILKASECLFAEKGYDGASIGAIAKLAGVSKANIYHHFASKDELYSEILKRALSVTGDNLQTASHGKGSLHSRLTRFLSDQLAVMDKHDAVYNLLLRELSELGSPRGRKIAEELIKTYFEGLVDLLLQAQKAGYLKRHTNPQVAASQITAMNIFLFQYRSMLAGFVDPDLSENPGNFCATSVRNLLDGITGKN